MDGAVEQDWFTLTIRFQNGKIEAGADWHPIETYMVMP